MSDGQLVYVMGPSGAGKNSVIARAREQLRNNHALYFTHRYVTRRNNTDDDDFAISKAAFAHYERSGLFAMHWQAHGVSYGIGMFIDTLLRNGTSVVVNGSRAYLPAAQARYPRITPVMIAVPPAVARGRLEARGREDGAAIQSRLQRAQAVTLPADGIITIDNSGPLENAAQALIRVLTASNGPTASQ